MSDIGDLNSLINLGRSGIALLREAAPFIPDAPKRKEIEEKADAQEAALQQANAQLAKDLGYQLCRCTFPPQIMLFEHEQNQHRCSKCGHTISLQPKVTTVGRPRRPWGSR